MTDEERDEARNKAKEERAKHPTRPGEPEDRVAEDVELEPEDEE